MKKKIIALSLLAATFAFTSQSMNLYATSGEEAAKSEANYELTRNTFENTTNGLVFNRLKWEHLTIMLFQF